MNQTLRTMHTETVRISPAAQEAVTEFVRITPGAVSGESSVKSCIITSSALLIKLPPSP